MTTNDTPAWAPTSLPDECRNNEIPRHRSETQTHIVYTCMAQTFQVTETDDDFSKYGTGIIFPSPSGRVDYRRLPTFQNQRYEREDPPLLPSSMSVMSAKTHKPPTFQYERYEREDAQTLLPSSMSVMSAKTHK